MNALQLVEHGKPGRLIWQQVAAPSPGPLEVVIDIHACGLNHLDLWFEEKGLPIPVALPRTPGCEPAGIIRAIGADVHGWKPGDAVAIQSNLTCGTCEACSRQEDSMCSQARLLGVEVDGGFAEQLVIPASQLVKLPPGMDPVTSASLSLAASTAMHMLTDRIQVQPGQTVLVIGGASGVGSAAIQIARQLGAKVCSTGSTEAKRQLALQLGADLALDPSLPSWPRDVRQWTAKRGVDVIVEHVGGPVLNQCFECLARGGSIVTCGATAGREVSLNLWPLFVKQQRLIGSYSRNRRDLEQTLLWAAQGRIKPVIDQILPMSRGAEAFSRLRERNMLGKLVLVPDDLHHGR